MPFLDANGLMHVASIIESNYAGKNGEGAVVSIGADYAEFADWADGNPDNDDRKGYFVTIDSGTNDIQIADSESAIIGVITDSAGFIGNYVKGAEEDSSKGLVGVLGQITVIDNGTCNVGKRCMPNDDGSAVPSDNTCGYKVIERIDATHVKIMVAPGIDMIQRIRTDVGALQDGAPYYSFNEGIQLDGTENLDEIIEPGLYTYGGVEPVSSSPVPTTRCSFKLLVERWNSREVTQTLTYYSNTSSRGFEWFRSHDDNGWKSWVCVVGIDPILAEGTSGGWRYVKYVNGNAVLWRRDASAANRPMTVGQSYSYSENTYNFPFTLNNPVAVAGAQVPGYLNASARTITANAVITRIYDLTKSATIPGSGYVSTYVIGSWK